MYPLTKIINHINNNQERIISDIDFASVEAYKQIQDLFLKVNVSESTSFQLKFNSFYRLNGAALTQEFKSAYYNILEENRNIKDFEDFQVKEILLDLFKYENYKGNKCLQFSFTTKLIHTINNDLPIYDSMIKSIFGFKGPHYYSSTNERINIYLNQYKDIKDTYKQIIESKLLNEIFLLFNNKFANYSLSKVKTLDFIFWTAGKLDKD